MSADTTTELDAKQAQYKEAVDAWIDSIRHEEDLASGDHSVAEIDAWEQAGRDEEALRKHAKVAKEHYEAALRKKFFGF